MKPCRYRSTSRHGFQDLGRNPDRLECSRDVTCRLRLAVATIGRRHDRRDADELAGEIDQCITGLVPSRSVDGPRREYPVRGSQDGMPSS